MAATREVAVALSACLACAALTTPADAAMWDKALIRRVLRRAAEPIHACMQQHDLPSGRYVVFMSIDAEGKVQVAEIRERPPQANAAGLACLETAYRSVPFPKGVGTVNLTYPVVLQYEAAALTR